MFLRTFFLIFLILVSAPCVNGDVTIWNVLAFLKAALQAGVRYPQAKDCLIQSCWQMSDCFQGETRTRLRSQLEAQPDVGAAPIYDAVIHVSSLQNISDGWLVEYPKTGTLHQVLASSDIKTTGIIGGFDTGKSFTLSKITKIPIPFGFDTTTKGMSVVILQEPKSDAVIFIDTEGSERATATEPGKLQDRRATDEFLVEATMLVSDIVLYCTGPLRGSSQPLLQKMVDKFQTYSSKEKEKDLIFIHNFQQFSTLDEVDKYVQSDLEVAFKCTKKMVDGRVFWVHTDPKSKAKFVHVVLASEGTPAGDHWNEQSLAVIKNLIGSALSYEKPPLLSAVSETVESLLPQYFHEDKPDRCPKYTGNYFVDVITNTDQRLKKSWKQLRESGFVRGLLKTFLTEENEPFKVTFVPDEARHVLRLQNPRELTLLPFSENFPNGRFVPKYHTQLNSGKWHLRVDLPGIPEKDLIVKRIGSDLAISGMRCDDISDPGSLGQFSLAVQIPSTIDGEQVDKDNCVQEHQFGVFSYVCPLILMKEDV